MMSSVFHPQTTAIDRESLVAGVLLAGIGVGNIYLESYQLSAFDYLALVLGSCAIIFYLTVIEKYSNSSTSRRVMRATFIVIFVYIAVSAPIVGSTLLVGFGVGFLINGFRARLVSPA
jgi:uncharacterized membrane protein